MVRGAEWTTIGQRALGDLSRHGSDHRYFQEFRHSVANAPSFLATETAVFATFDGSTAGGTTCISQCGATGLLIALPVIIPRIFGSFCRCYFIDRGEFVLAPAVVHLGYRKAFGLYDFGNKPTSYRLARRLQ
jgi:hypothetical protein